MKQMRKTLIILALVITTITEINAQTDKTSNKSLPKASVPPDLIKYFSGDWSGKG